MLPWRWHVRRLRLAAALSWALGGFCFALLLAAVAPMALGLKSYTVRSDSMSPAIETGDVVVTRQIAPAEAEVGDIVTFKDPDGSGDLITHRARAIARTPAGIAFVTRGDANNAAERWTVSADGRIGRLSYRIPLLGYPLSVFGTAPGKLALVALPALVLLGLVLLRIWAPERVGAPPETSQAGGR